jgi:hypothetical protein
MLPFLLRVNAMTFSIMSSQRAAQSAQRNHFEDRNGAQFDDAAFAMIR